MSTGRNINAWIAAPFAAPAALLTIVVMVFAGSSYGPFVSGGSLARIVVTIFNAPVYLLPADIDRFPTPLFIAAYAALEFLYFLLICIAVRAVIERLASKRSANAP